MATRTEQSIDPMDPQDYLRLLNAPTIVNDHYGRGPVSGHSGRPGARCHQCSVMAFEALVPLGARARRRGWTRQEALDHLDDEPAAVDTLAKDGQQKTRTAAGCLADPTKAADNVAYQKALVQAREGGDLAVTVRVATEVLKWVIRSVQDQTSVLEHGKLVAWERLEDALCWEERQARGEIPEGVRAEAVWAQIERACSQHRAASAKLDDHVGRHSANRSRHTMVDSAETDDGVTVERISNLPEDRSLTASDSGNQLHDMIVLRVYERVVRVEHPTRKLLVDTTRRVLRDHQSLEDTRTDAINAYCELVADDTETLLERNDPTRR